MIYEYNEIIDTYVLDRLHATLTRAM